MSFNLIYNEKALAEKMVNGEIPVEGYNLAVFAKWYKWQHLQELGLTYSELDASRRKRKEVNDQIWHELDNITRRCGEVESAATLNRAVAKTNKVRLQTADNPIPITKFEKAVLESIENDKERRMMFIYLFEAKFNVYNSVAFERKPIDEDTLFLVHDNNYKRVIAYGTTMGLQPKKDQYLISYFKNQFKKTTLLDAYPIKVKDPAKRYECVWNDKTQNWVDVPMYVDDEITKVTFVDINDSPDNVAEWITDFEHLDLHYEKMFGLKNIGVCEKCGCLYRKGRGNNQRYCYKHRGYVKKELKKVRCIDCGKEFYVAASNKRQIRCDDCQKARREEDIRIAVQKRRKQAV